VFFVFFALILQVSDFVLLKEDSKPEKDNDAKKDGKAKKGTNNPTHARAKIWEPRTHGTRSKEKKRSKSKESEKSRNADT
jgi:hypothetical protein